MEKREKWLVTLKVMAEYMPNVNIVKDVLNNMKNNGLRVPLPRQEETLLRLFDKSYKRKQMMAEITRRLEQNETIQMSREMNKKFQEQQVQPNVQVYVNTSPASINRYGNEGEIEKKPIGFQQKSTLTPFDNRYKPKMNPALAHPKNWSEEQWNNWYNE